MRTLPSITLALICPLASLLAQAPAPAPAPAAAPAAPAALNLEQEVEQLYGEATTAFNRGTFDVALQKIAAIHTKTSDRDFERVMFLEGACHYNLEAYDKAIEFLQKFVTTYPNSEVLHEAKMSLGRAYLKLKKEDEGVKVLKEVATIPTLRDQAGLEIAFYFKSNNKPDQALEILETILKDLAGPPSQEQQQGILMAAEIYIGKGDSDQASAMIEKLRSGASADESIVQLNNLGVKVGDAMLEQKRYREALLAYQSVRRHSEILRIQKGRVEAIEGWIKQIDAGRRVYFMGRTLSKDEAQSLLTANKTILDEITKATDYDAAIYYKLGQSFYEMGRYYESLLAFTKIFDEFTEFPDRHRCLFGMIVCNAALKRSARAYTLCEQYMNLFPEGPNAPQVTEMFGGLAYESGNINAAVRAFQKAIASPGADKERLNYLLGIVLFESQQFDDSRAAFQSLLEVNKESAYKDEAQYRIALTYFFQNDSVGTRRALRDYIAQNARGQFVVDARYRLAFIDFQGGDKEGARKELEALVKESPNDPNIGQVFYLLGDIYSQMPPPREEDATDYTLLALNAYRSAVEKAKTNDVLSFALEAANNMMVDRGMWNEISDMWSTQYNSKQGTPEALKAIHWISRAKEREASQLLKEGKTTEAEAKSDEARKLVAKEAFPFLGNPANEQVEMLLQQLISMILPKKRSRNISAEAATADIETYEKKFRDILLPEGDASLVNGTAAARVLFARALIARSLRDIPKYDNIVSIIPDAAKAEELSPLLLSTLGEMLLKRGDFTKATEYFNILRTKYPDSEFGDKAPIGLAAIAYEQKDYDKALELYNEAIEKYVATSGILDAYLGKAKTLMALAKFDEATELYDTIRNNREWRGEATAISLFMLGQIADAQAKHEEALGWYQRCFLTQRRYKDWFAKSYLHAAKACVKLNRREDAVKLLREMLARTDIQDQPEFNEAQQLLPTLGS
ncbi:tetratricopeptide repeat protein [Phragmitibacter flavus]|nr:tetratricopeptide repeat protein [Phragmitibacter flavus]